MNNPSPEFNSLNPALKVNRRGFIVTALGAGFAVAMQPIMAQTTIKTDTNGLLAGEIKVPVTDGEMVAYRAQPANGAHFPVVLVVSEIFGVHEYIADVCRRLAKLGYLAIAPELFARYGDPRKPASVDEVLSGIVAKVPDAGVMSDLDACVAWAGKHGGNVARLAITGFCWGGRITWLYAAHNPKLKAAVSWYGQVDGPATELRPKHPLDIVGALKVPVLGLYGGADQGIVADDVDALKDAIKKAGGKSQIHVYPDAGHAFHTDYRPTYRKAEAEDGWKRLQAWFKTHGV